MRKITTFVLGALLAGTLLGSAVSAYAEEPVELSFWSIASRKDVEENVIAAYQEAHPDVTITATFYSTDDIKTNLKIAASSNSMPDMWYNWGGSLASYYPENGLTYDFSQIAEDENWGEKFLPAALELCTLGGQLSGIPQSIAMMNIWYRKDVFEECGIEIPQTFEELEAACDTLKEAGYIPFATGGQFGWHVSRYLQDLIEYYGGIEEHDALNLMEADWGTSEAVAKALAKLKDWADKGYFNDGFLTEDPNDCRMYLFNKRAGMIIDSPTMAQQVLNAEQDPSLYGFFGFPTQSNEDGTGRMAAYVKMTQVNANVTDAQLAAILDFWDFYYDAEANPQFGSVEQPIARNGAVLPETYALADGVMELMGQNGIYTQIDQALPAEVYDQLHTAQDQVISGDVAPEEAGALVQSAVTAWKANQ